MAIGNRQIGWSQEDNLLWEISKQLDRMNSIICTGPCPTSSTTSTTSTTTTAELTTTTTTTICNCREIIEAASFGFNFYTCLGDYIECFNPGECISPVGECIDISQPYNNVVPSETITETCNCNPPPLVNTGDLFQECSEPCGTACGGPFFFYYNVWMTQECIDTFPTIGCEIWYTEDRTVPFPDGTYNIGDGTCIVITGGIITDILT